MRDVILLRFGELYDAVLPSDTAEQLEDLAPDVANGVSMPPVTEGAYTGRGRSFLSSLQLGLSAVDRPDGNTTLTRTMSVQAILNLDLAEQEASGAGTIICRGKDPTSEPYAYGLELRVVNLSARVVEMRFIWADIDGNEHLATGAWFVWPASSSQYLMLSATRRWVSSTEVVVRYFVGGQMVGEFTESEGDIGGGTDDTTTIGYREEAGGTPINFLSGVIDELRVVDYELAPEEIEATWLRISQYQPMGVQLYIEQHPPGWPVSFDPSTRSGREAQVIGNGLGYAAAQIENFRANMMPDRAYGRTLERWENIVGVEEKHGDSIERRRERVLARMRQRQGASPPGVRIALEELMATDRDNIEVIAFSNIIEDDFDTLEERRWQVNPAWDGLAGWHVVAGELVVVTASSTNQYPIDWYTCLTGVDGPARIGGYGAQMFAKVDPTTLPNGGEVGICLYDKVRKDALMLGVRNDGGAYKVISQRYIDGVATAAITHATTSNTPHWLHLGATPVDYSGQEATDQVDHFVRWSTTSATEGFTTGDPAPGIGFSFVVGWCGFYARGWASPPGAVAITAAFDDAKVFFPHGNRPFYFYALRDAELPGDYDLASASATLRKLKQAHTHACAITSRDVLCDDPDSGCSLGPCGGI